MRSARPCSRTSDGAMPSAHRPVSKPASSESPMSDNGAPPDDRDENNLDAGDRIRNALVDTLDAIESGRLSTRKLIARLSPKINDFLATPGAGDRVQRWTLGDLQR